MKGLVIFTIIFMMIVIPAVSADLLFSDGFESGDFSEWSGTGIDAGNNLTVNISSAKNGGYGMNSSDLSTTNDDAYAYYNLGSGYTELYGVLWLKIVTGPATQTNNPTGFFEYGEDSSAGDNGMVGIDYNGVDGLDLVYWTAGTNWATSTFDWPSNEWIGVRLRVLYGDTEGELEIATSSDGETWTTRVNLTGLDTGEDAGDSAAMDFIRVGTRWASSQISNIYIDDVAIDNETWPTLNIGDFTPPTWSTNQTNDTLAGHLINHSVSLADEVALDYYIFEFNNGTEALTNLTTVDISGTTATANQTIRTNSTAGTLIQWRYYFNDTNNNWNRTDLFNYTTTADTTPPTWSTNATNSTNAGVRVNHSIVLADNLGLDYYIFEFDNGTSLSNISTNDITGTPVLANQTIIVNSTSGARVRWRYYFNDTSNNWNRTDLFSYVLNTTNATSNTSLKFAVTFASISIYANFSGDTNNNSNTSLEYRTIGGSWIAGMNLTVDRRTTVGGSANTFKNQWRGSILGLSANTTYEVRINYTDPDGVTTADPNDIDPDGIVKNHSITANVTTRDDSFPSSGNSYYVNTTGNDATGDGSAPTPWRTIQKAINSASAGDTIHVSAGVYNERVIVNKSGTSTNWITIRNYGTDNASVTPPPDSSISTHMNNSFTINANYTKIKGFDMREANWGVRITQNSHDVVIEDNYITKMYPNGTDAEGNFLGSAAIVIGTSFSSVGHTQTANVANVTIQRNVLHMTEENTGDDDHSAINVLGGTKGGNVIRNNTIMFLYLEGAGHGEDCISSDPNSGYNDNFRDTDIYNNLCSASTDDGIEMDGNDVNLRVWNNTIDGSNIGFSLGPVNVGPVYIFRNIVYNLTVHWKSGADWAACTGVKEGDGSTAHVFVYHNTFHLPNATINGSYCTGATPNAVQDSAGQPSAQNLIFKNNIFHFDQRLFSNTAGAHESNYNLIFNFSVETQDIFSKWNGNSYSNFTSYVDGTGQDKNSTYGQATFVNANNGDFHLVSGGLGIDNGTIIQGFNDANSAWAYSGSGPDMGAFELQSESQAFSANVTGSLTLSGNTLSPPGRNRQITGPIDLSTDASRLAHLTKIVTTTLKLSDVLNIISTRLTMISQAFDVSNTIKIYVGRLRQATDSLDLVDNIQTMMTRVRLPTNSIDLNENIKRMVSFTRSLTSAVDISDVIASNLARLRELTQTMEIGDNIASYLTRVRNFPQSMDISESMSDIVSFIRPLTNALDVTDVVNAIRTVPRELMQSMDVNDNIRVILTRVKQLTNAINLANSVHRIQSFTKLFTDSFSLVGNIITVTYETFEISVIESVNLDDNIRILFTRVRLLSNALNLVDVHDRLMYFTRSVANAMDLTDGVFRIGSVMKLVTGWFALSEKADGERNTLNIREVFQSIGISDGISRIQTFTRSIIQAIDFSEVISKFFTRVVSSILQLIISVIGGNESPAPETATPSPSPTVPGSPSSLAPKKPTPIAAPEPVVNITTAIPATDKEREEVVLVINAADLEINTAELDKIEITKISIQKYDISYRTPDLEDIITDALQDAKEPAAKQFLADINKSLSLNTSSPLDTSTIIEQFKIMDNATNKTAYSSKITLILHTDRKLYDAKVVEIIPKSMADSVNDIVFLGEQPNILQDDPIVNWIFPVIGENETINISYMLGKKVDRLDARTVASVRNDVEEKSLISWYVIWIVAGVTASTVMIIAFKRLKIRKSEFIRLQHRMANIQKLSQIKERIAVPSKTLTTTKKILLKEMYDIDKMRIDLFKEIEEIKRAGMKIGKGRRTIHKR